jgi:hypothetical protein
MTDSIRIDSREQLAALAARLRVRPDWHEPNEQDVTALVHGTPGDLDNAGFWGHRPGTKELDTYGDGRQELWVEIFAGGKPVAEINLADLLAWAAERDSLSRVTAEEAESMAWEKVREHLRAAVVYGLDHYGGHARGGSIADRDAWRAATPENLAEAITTFAMAGIGPVLTREQIDNGLVLLRAVLAKAGIDPATLDWHQSVPSCQRCGVRGGTLLDVGVRGSTVIRECEDRRKCARRQAATS